jgi:hypothetical protein
MTTKTYYADKFNARYSFSQSDYVDIPTRFSQFVDENKMIEIKMACREFKRRNPQYKTWQDVLDALCIAVPNKGSDIMVDTTMQRTLLIDKCIARVDNFKVTKVMPVQVTPHPTEDTFVCGWDGQHTAILLYIICVFVFGEQWDESILPTVVYRTSDKAEIRENFIGLNGEDKTPLDSIDIWMQMIYGVRVDGSDNPVWLEAEAKQQQLEKFKLFATHQKFDDAHEVGAISRMQEIDKATPEDINLFGIYWAGIRQHRSVEPKEIYMMMTWIMLCRTEGVKLDEDYMLDLADMNTSFFRADFSPSGPFWAKAELAYENWHESKYKDFADEDKPEPSMQKLPTHGIPFFNAQIKKTLKRKVPSYFANNGFTPAEEDLW